jgi:hypothetical protein
MTLKGGVISQTSHKSTLPGGGEAPGRLAYLLVSWLGGGGWRSFSQPGSDNI